MAQPLKVLMVEDHASDAGLAVLELRNAGFEPEWLRVDTEAAFLEQLNGGIDVVLSDYQMPEFSGLRALELWKQSGLQIPFILVSGTIGEEIAVAAIKRGATDYVMKDRLARLGAAVKHALEEIRLRRERQQADEALRLAHIQLSQLLEHSPAVLYVLKLTGAKIVPHVISEGINALLGFTVAETLSYEWWVGQMHPEDRESVVESVTETIAAGATRTEYRLRHKDGHYCWVEDTRRLIRDAAGTPVELIGVWTEITERRRAEEIVRQASGAMAQDRRKRVIAELAILAGATALFFVLAGRFNWFEAATQWILANELDQLDEIVFTIVFFVAGLAVFAFRRWRETESELTSHHQAQAALGLLHGELDRRVKQRTEELGKANVALRAEIIERRRAESIVRVSEHRLREMLANLELIAMTLDQKGIVTFCNDFLLRLTGWKREEVIGQRWFDQFLPDSAAAEKRMFLATIDRGQLPRHYRNPIKTRTGELREIAWNNTVLRNGAGDIVGSASIGEDITERSRAEAALRESEAQFRQVVENIGKAVSIYDPEKTRLLYISPTYEKIWGRSCASLYAAPGSWLDAIHPDDRVRIQQAAHDKKAAGSYDEEYRIEQPDGSLRWVHDRAFLVHNAAGGIHRLVGVAEDITERRQLDEHFLQAQKMEALGQFSGGVAHDFNNILAAVGGYTELARMQLKDNPNVREHLDAVLQASARAADLVRQILTFSRQQTQERRIMQLQPVVAESLKLMRATLPATIEFDPSIAADAPTVLANANQVHQVLMNLGINASHAMKDRTGRLQVTLERCAVTAKEAATHQQLRPGVYARVCVRDTGCGMDAATLRRIFEPFFTTKPVGEGTGLGLAVVHGIMDTHDGAVTVQSQPGEGTVFSLYFPAHGGEEVVAAAEAEAVPRGHGERILVVDDEELLAQLHQKTLVALGYAAEFATKPLDAIARVQADPSRFALVLTDHAMPGMTGLDFASQLRQLRPGLPIVLMTGNSLSLSPERVKAAGIRQLLPKPTTIQSLGLAVHAALSD